MIPGLFKPSLGQFELRAQLRLKLDVNCVILPVLAPQLLVKFSAHSHLHVHLVVVVLFKLLEIVVFLEELIDLFLLFLIVEDGLCHLAFAGLFGQGGFCAEGFFCVL
jgi:hypothetical protein